MKYFIILLLSIQVSVGSAQDLLVSTTQPNFDAPHANLPYAGQESTLWVRGGLYCQFVFNIVTDYEENVVNVFLITGPPTPCPPPPPGIFDVYGEVTKINALPEGMYTVNLYRVPYTDPFPPSDQDLASYKESELQFEILRAVSVDATSHYSLFILISLILGLCAYSTRRDNRLGL